MSKLTKATGNLYSEKYKQEALGLAGKLGVATAARELEPHESRLYAWRSKAIGQRKISEREQELMAEVARLKRHLSRQDEEVAILKNRRRTSRISLSEVRPDV